ncbi:MAG: hypothetical protein AAF533_28865 [Acidobacteriota bacterium]
MSRRLLRFVGLALGLFLLFNSPPVRWAYSHWFVGSLNLAYASCGGDRMAELAKEKDEHGRFDTVLRVGSKRAGRYVATLPLSSTRQGLIPITCFLALLLATPISWADRGRACLLGLLLLQVFTILRVGITLLLGFASIQVGESSSLLPWPEPVVRFLAFLELPLGSNLTTGYVVGLGCWLLLCHRHLDLDELGLGSLMGGGGSD